MRISRQRSWIPCILLDVPINRPDARQLSNIRPDDVDIPFGLPSVSKSFELLRVASVQTSQQHVRTPFSVRQVKEFLSQTQIWEDNCNHPDAILDKVRRWANLQPFGHQVYTVRMPILIMKIVCSWSATIRTLGQHRRDAALFMKEFQWIWKACCTVGRPDALSYRPDPA
jgi:hypothetical protein